MAEHVSWILEFERSNYGAKQIFITGHNSHIGKTSATYGTKSGMGELLAEQYGDEYYVIGTEFYISRFLAPDSMSGERTEFEVQNDSEERLAFVLHQSGKERLFFDIIGAAADPKLEGYLKAKQPFSMIGESFSRLTGASEMGYTQKLAPLEAFDGLIFVDEAAPSTMLENN